MAETGLEPKALASQSSTVWYLAGLQNLLGFPRSAAAPSQPPAFPPVVSLGGGVAFSSPAGR